MARIRTIKPEVWMSPQVMNLSHGARLLFIGLITQADDQGKGVADARKLKAAIFGGDDITSSDVRRWLDECSMQGLAILYTDESHGDLYALTSWKRHQSIDRPKASTYPNPDDPGTARRPFVDSRTTNREGSDRTGPDRKGPEGIVSLRARDPEPDGQQTAAPYSDTELADGFAAVRLAYPAFSGRQDWLKAEHHWRMRIEEGVTPDQLIAGVDRYASFVKGGGVSGPAYVLTPGNFFGAADKPWAQAWEPPTTKAETRLAGNLSAADEFLRRTEATA